MPTSGIRREKFYNALAFSERGRLKSETTWFAREQSDNYRGTVKLRRAMPATQIFKKLLWLINSCNPPPGVCLEGQSKFFLFFMTGFQE
jgi:hypothetical protein